MLEDNIEAAVCYKYFKGSNDISMLKLSIQVQRLFSYVSRKRSAMDELNRRDLTNRHFHWLTELNIVDLFVLFPRGFPRGSEQEGGTLTKSIIKSMSETEYRQMGRACSHR
jgi:hypothetical protein